MVGDARRYSRVITLCVVETFDFMTCPMGASTVLIARDYFWQDFDEVADVWRVAYDISSKLMATIEWK